MRKMLLLLPALLLSFIGTPTHAQEARAEGEDGAVRQVVETYLYAEEGEERKRTLFPQAKILSVDPGGRKVVEKPISQSATSHKGARQRSRQRIISIDVTEGAASVKVETDLSSETLKVPTHVHYLSLLKVNGKWQIVGILMPPLGRPEAAGK